jgi:serine/threonine-protein kinase
MGRDDERPRKLGNYEVLREIGQGGMGVVYLARQPALERLVVLKKMRRDLVGDPGLVQRFQREARAAAAIHHQNVVTVYNCFSLRGDHYITQEFVGGPDLRAILAKLGHLRARIAALVALEVARGLEEIHARGIVHRDLKPANILIGSGGETKIADFGIALESTASGLTRPGTMVGSLPYMSPEQLLGQRVDHRSDVFLFGMLLYEMVAGGPPFQIDEEESTDRLLEQMRRGEYLSASSGDRRSPRYLERLIRNCLQPNPGKRVQTSSAIRRYLERKLGRLSQSDCRAEISEELWRLGVIRVAGDKTARRPASRPAARPSASGRRLAWAAGAAVALTVSLFGAWSTGLIGRETAGPDAEVQLATTAPPPAVTDTPRAVDATLMPPPEEPPVPNPDLSATEPTLPAQIHFVVDPWAEVQLPDGTHFYTPRAFPVELPSGRQVIRLEHPTFGGVEYELDLEPGENRRIEHVFERADPR